VSGCHGHHGFERLASSARCEALSQPRVISRSCRFFEDHNPVGVVLVDLGVERDHDPARDPNNIEIELNFETKNEIAA
jgi:hypothetical protein